MPGVIKAYIRRERLDGVVNVLAPLKKLNGVSLSTVTGFGRSRGRLRFVDFESHIKIEVVCADALVDRAIASIQTNACTGHRENGKIFVSTVDGVVRVETGEVDAQGA